MSAVIRRATAVEDHPKKGDTVSVVSIGEEQFVAQKITKMGGTKSRYAPGDLLLYVPGGNILPEWLARRGYWDDEAGKGVLEGKDGLRVKAQNFGGVRSHGVHFELIQHGPDSFAIELENGDQLPVVEGQELGELLGITEWTPPS
jgi:hypothetical protein